MTQKPVEPRRDIHVFVYAAGTERILCRLERLTIMGAEVILADESPTVFPVGGEVNLRFNESKSGANLKVVCRVTDRKTTTGLQIYGVRFRDPKRIRSLLRPVLAKLFSGRQSFRATPRIAQPIMVDIEPPTEAYVSTINVPMVDLSTDGMALLVPFDFEEEMAGFDVVRVAFNLPKGEYRIEMACIIRNRHAEPDGVRYGLQFYGKGTDLYPQKLDDIIKFVMDRQREQLDDWDDPTGPGFLL